MDVEEEGAWEGEEEASELVGGEREEGVQYMTAAIMKGHLSGDLEEVVVIGCMEASSF